MTKLLLPLVACAFAALITGCATTPPKKSAAAPGQPVAKVSEMFARPGKPGQRVTVRTTAYTHTEPGGIKNAVGSRLRFKSAVRSAASDWSWMPLGTRFRMCSTAQEYVIEDYGSALVGRRTIDLYKPTRRLMNAWGMRYVEIEILEWGSPTMSYRLLKDRQKYWHCRAMVAALRKIGADRPSGS